MSDGRVHVQLPNSEIFTRNSYLLTLGNVFCPMTKLSRIRDFVFEANFPDVEEVSVMISEL